MAGDVWFGDCKRIVVLEELNNTAKRISTARAAYMQVLTENKSSIATKIVANATILTADDKTQADEVTAMIDAEILKLGSAPVIK